MAMKGSTRKTNSQTDAGASSAVVTSRLFVVIVRGIALVLLRIGGLPLIRPAGHLLPAGGEKEMCGRAGFPHQRGGTVPHTPSPRLRGEGGGSRMRGFCS